MTYEEAIKVLTDTRVMILKGSNTDLAKVCSMAIEALEKQIPKKPSWEYLGVSLSGNNLITKCPLCDKGVEEGEHHCECGQALDWSE